MGNDSTSDLLIYNDADFKVLHSRVRTAAGQVEVDARAVVADLAERYPETRDGVDLFLNAFVRVLMRRQLDVYRMASAHCYEAEALEREVEALYHKQGVPQCKPN